MAKGESMKIIEMAKDIKLGEKVLDTGTSFVVKEIRVHLEHGLIAFLDTEDVGHGYYHPALPLWPTYTAIFSNGCCNVAQRPGTQLYASEIHYRESIANDIRA